MKLEPADIRRLDNLLAFYASSPQGGCTTVDTVEASLYRSKNLLRTATFTDASCSAGNAKSRMTFGELAGRLQAKP
jgi:hypothetical protein